MKKKIILTFIFLLCFITFFYNYNVEATSKSNFDAISKQDVKKVTGEDISNQKIMRYDAKTKTSVEVNIDEIVQNLKNKKGTSYNNTSTAPNLIPKYFNGSENLFSQVFRQSYLLNPFNTRTSYYMRINNVYDFPHRTISKITTSNGSGTGTIIKRNVVITSAHVIMDGDCNIYDNLTIMPGYNERSTWK